MSQRQPTRDYIPALSYHWLTPLYDSVITVFTREHRWRSQFVNLIDPRPGDTILDVGCGTGSTAIARKLRCPDARIIGIDPDPRVLKVAREKAGRRHLEIEFHIGYGQAPPELLKEIRFSKVVSSMMLHHIQIEQKHETLAAARVILEHRGSLCIADFGQQRSRLMRLLFRSVQVCDGFATTQSHADGHLPDLISAAGFADVVELEAIPTAVGSISLFRASPG